MRRVGIIIVGLFLCFLGLAQEVSVSEAYQKAQTFMSEKGKQVVSMPRKAPGTHGKEAAAFYVFNAPDNEGFVLVSGDSRLGDILGYCDQGTYDEERMPDNMRAWLVGYTDQVKALRQGKAEAARKVQAHAAIRPWLTSKWDQGVADANGDAYNRQCPKVWGAHCVTGCVATAMAQVMRFHKWPVASTAMIPSYQSNGTVGTLSALQPRQFDWDNMLDQYQGDESTTLMDAVAWLMRYCGQAVEMDYGTDASGAYSEDVAKALRTYFDYDTNTRHVLRSDYMAEGWDDLIYSELRSRRPVFYSGASTGGGHAFVCDGCDNQGFFHINWGWNGYYDGYYKLSLLNPSGGGTGGGGTEDGYTMDQGAVVGIQKSTGNTDDGRILNLYDLTYSGSSIEATYWNRTGMSGTFQYGLAYQAVGGDTYNFAYQTAALDPLDLPSYTLNVNTLNLTNGTYRFYPYSCVNGESWSHLQGDGGTYIEVVIQSGQAKSMIAHPQADLHVVSVDCVGNKIVGSPQEVKIKVKNNGEEFNDVYYLFASRNTRKGQPVSETCMVIEAGVTEETSLYFTPTSTGTWNLWISTNESGTNASGPYTVDIASAPSGSSNLALTNYTVDTTEGVDLHVTVKNNASQGYYQSVACAIFSEESSSSVKLYESGNLNLAAGETANLTYHFEGLTPGKQYYAKLARYPQYSSSSLTLFGESMYFVPQEMIPNDVTLTISSAGVGTFASPYDLDFTDVTGMKAYIASGFDPSQGKLVLTQVDEVPAGTGLYVKGTAGTYYIPVKETMMFFSNLLVGVTETTQVSPTEGNMTNFILANGVHGLGFYTLSKTGPIAAGKAYLSLPTRSVPAAANYVALEFEDEETTGISEEVIVNSEESADEWYTLDGRKLEKRPTQKGVYIMNGKKQVIR